MIGYALTAFQVRLAIRKHVPDEFVNYSTLPIVLFDSESVWRALTVDGTVYDADRDMETGEYVLELPVLTGGQVVTCDVPAGALMARGVWFDTAFGPGGRVFDHWLRANGGVGTWVEDERCAPVEPDERETETLEIDGRRYTVFVDPDDDGGPTEMDWAAG